MKLLRVLVLLSGAFLMSCASSVEKDMNQEVAQESGVHQMGGVAAKSYKIINDSDKLSSQQKKDLLALHSKTQAEMEKIRFQMGKLKGTFFKNLIAQGPKSKQVNVLRKKMTKLHGQKLDVMLDSLDGAKKILGSVDDPQIYDAFMFDAVPMNQ